MTFDPFGDFESRGYLRNIAGLRDSRAVKEFEHRAFLEKLPEAVAQLEQVKRLSYRDVLETHRILFEEVYPWAGQDRAATAPHIAIARGGRNDLFAHPQSAGAAIDYALKLGQDPAVMAGRPGEVMGHLAYGHPFLDGNGRTLLVVHNALAHRAGFAIDWTKTSKDAYLDALTQELDRPGRGALDSYLKPFVTPATSRDQAVRDLSSVRSLGPDREPGRGGRGR
jgi:cell filamentation protein